MEIIRLLNKRLLLAFTAIMLLANTVAQTNVTNKLKNPSFESDFTGWTQSGMQTQTNTSFSKKDGNKYVEKWTGRGGAVGSCSVTQTITGLTPGRYRLTACAQNIQEDTPTNVQTGAWLVANNVQENVGVTAEYAVEFLVLDGSATVGFCAVEATGNWIAVDNFRLYLLDDARDEMLAMLQQVIADARSLYGDGTGADAETLRASIQAAESVSAATTSTSADMAEAVRQLNAAQDSFRLTNASETAPYDMTSRLTNPSFEDGFNGWTQSGMQLQGNSSFMMKDGVNYVERWTGRGGAVGDGSVLQQVKDLPCGLYRLTAVAQNIQEDTPNVTKAGAWIVGDYTRKAVGISAEYSMTFIVITGDANVGFVAEGAKGNWIACDNFRLEYLGVAMEQQEAEMQQRIATAEPLLNEHMTTAALDALQTAITQAETVSDKQYVKAAIALREAQVTAEASIQAYATLLQAIATAETVCNTGAGNDRDTFQAVIDAAQSMYDRLDSQNEAMTSMVTELEKAAFAYRVSNGTGTTPRVTTDKRYVRGAIEAFGRMTVSGINSSQIMEQGFCWSTNPNPTVLDNRSTDYLENNGRIYRMSMNPATIYYIRAYAITKNYAVGYGDVIKISTLPMGDVTYTYYNNDGGDFHNNKNTKALSEACWYWSNYTSIRGFHVTANYSSGTPTADCGYGGNMRIGSNTGQRTGTMMHEMNHGIGGGTIGIWGGWEPSWMRSGINGDWVGERANGVVQFWENRDDITITAAYDGAHWGIRANNETYSSDNNWCNKYPFNGSHLEAGNWAGPQNWNDTQIAYIGNSLIQQGFCEDGLVPVNYYSGGFCLPAYVFEQDDQTKYYIKCESEDYGLYDSYLTEARANKITWTQGDMSVSPNDSAAWYVSFDPATQYYTLRNAATNHVLTYSNGFKTANRVSTTANDKLHFIRGRKDVNMGNVTTRGYWMIHPENSNTPPALTAAAAGAVSASAVNLYDQSAQQRWLFIAADQLEDFEQGTVQNLSKDLLAYIRQLRKLKSTPHVEDSEGADDLFDNDLAGIETSANAITNAAEVNVLKEEALNATIDFLSNVTPSNPQQPFDLTFMVENAAIDSNEGWAGDATYNESCCEFFQRTFDFYQILRGLPLGNFKLTAQGFQRPGAYESAYNNFVAGNNQVNAVLYAGTHSEKLQHFGEGAQSRRIHSDDVQIGTVYLPNTMASAAAYFKKKLYNNEVWAATNRKNASLRIGIKGTVNLNGYWTIFDQFHLYFYGTLTADDITGVTPTFADCADQHSIRVYNLKGQLVRTGSADLRDLPSGIYIINDGQKSTKVFNR